MKRISLTNGMSSVIDDEFYDELNRHSWIAKEGRSTYYARRSVGKGRYLWMHREVLRLAGVEGGPETDHRDGDGLNNQRHNIRPATASQNQANQRRRIDNNSGCKGVGFHRNRWRARIRINGKQETIGTYLTIQDAKRAYDVAAAKIHGDFALVGANC